jgi:hypothetical protein
MTVGRSEKSRDTWTKFCCGPEVVMVLDVLEFVGDDNGLAGLAVFKGRGEGPA